MAVEVTRLDGGVARQMGATPMFDSFCFHAWEKTAQTAHDYVAFLDAERAKASPAMRAYLSLEIIAASLETLEYLATTCAQAWGISGTPARIADNAVIRAVFTRMVEGPLSVCEVADLLRLPRNVPRLRRLEDPLSLRRIYDRVLRNGRRVLKDAGRVWLRQIDRAQWFRHFPAFLLPEDTVAIYPGENPDRDACHAALRAVEDRILVYALQDARTFHHEILRERDVDEARGLARASLDVLATRNSNTVLAPSSPDPMESRLKVIGVLLYGLSQEDRKLLRDHGQFFVA